jgi:hypothetical protein
MQLIFFYLHLMLYACAVRFLTVVFREKFLDLNTPQVTVQIVNGKLKLDNRVLICEGQRTLADVKHLDTIRS